MPRHMIVIQCSGADWCPNSCLMDTDRFVPKHWTCAACLDALDEQMAIDLSQREPQPKTEQEPTR